MDRFEITAARMAAGEPVGEGYLYGSDAMELGARRLVDAETIRKYRSAAYFARKNAYGIEAATAWEDAAKQRHEEARAVHSAKIAAMKGKAA